MNAAGCALRVGIDVGGTFTDVVAIDAASQEVVARVKVPTTHDAPEGVAAGIVEGIGRLCGAPGVAAAAIAFIAHSTTQATNALLEGDLATVGVLGLLDGAAWLSRLQMRFGGVALGDGIPFAPAFAFARENDERAWHAAIDELIARGAQAIAASRSFGVDRPLREDAAVAYARERGVDATSGHDVSADYGLRARTRTAALNAAILPKMLRTARMTASAVERASVPAPLMVMRSDGGVMDVREIERRPILTLLSGPAAGIAGALLYERLSEGIFIEVGGTSSDCSVIRSGRPQMKPAQIGGHRTMLRTLDVRTLGIGGGSMLRLEGNRLADVGPRSAHIAGCAYACFVEPAAFEGVRIESSAPYVAFSTPDGRRIAPTVTCAANFAGCVPEGAFARGNVESARAAFESLARATGGDAATLANDVLVRAAAKLNRTIDELIRDYQLDAPRIVLVGGGGGAGALVPFAAQQLQLPYRIARDAEVIAPIGVALALVRDVVERTIHSPTPQEIASIRREAADRAIAAGAAPDRVAVEIEIDTTRSRVRATASGATALADSATQTCSESERAAIAAQSIGCAVEDLERIDLTPNLSGYQRRSLTRGAFGRTREVRELRVVDERGVVRLALRDPSLIRTTAEHLATDLREAVEAATQFGDVGRALPALYLLRAARLAAFEGLTGADQAVALAAEETDGCAADERISLLVVAQQS